ncbi:MAG TPA: phage holin family protein [Roseiflexaceae bacterium]|nr:phage holin family protein [Roseiflexaceae bacterium]
MEPIPQQPISPWVRARSIVAHWLITSLAMFAAIYLVPGINFTGPGWEVGLVALVFALINTALRPILLLLTCPFVLLTFGLFTLVINAALLLLTAQIAATLGVDFQIASFWSALGGALVISLVTLVLNILTGETPVRVQVHRGPEA